ncbi:MAG: phosphoribosylformylglycinamidine synthase, partial [Deltaproteobacteria bacterium]|nr:phosphoribosylformylglycinamidine synthase [Deltaproteobacteria bacterium]
MPHRLEVTLKPHLFDAEGEQLRKKAEAYFDIKLARVRVVQVITMDVGLTLDQLKVIQSAVFTNPVTQMSSYEPVAVDFDWVIWVGFRPGVRDNPGSTAVEAITDVLQMPLKPGEAVYTSKRYCISGVDLDRGDVEKIARELLANGIIQQWRVFSNDDWDPATGIGLITPKVVLDHQPTLTTVPIESDAMLQSISAERNLALNSNDIPVIRAYFSSATVQEDRRQAGLSDPTDVEIEYISQAR